jgi:hypothetical protein
MTFARWVFRTAAVYGIVTLVPLYLLEAAVAAPNARLGHPAYFYGFIGVSLSAQVMFLTIAVDPARYRPMMIAAIFEKCSFGVAVWLLWGQGRASSDVLVFASLDLIWGALFAVSYTHVRAETAAVRQ